MLPYQGGEVKPHSVDEIKQRFSIGTIKAVVTSSEISIYCVEQLTAYYDCTGNNPLTTDWRQKKQQCKSAFVKTVYPIFDQKFLQKMIVLSMILKASAVMW